MVAARRHLAPGRPVRRARADRCRRRRRRCAAPAPPSLAGRQLAAHLERFDPSWDGDGVAPGARSSAPRRRPARSRNGWRTWRRPRAAPDRDRRTISVEWSVRVNDTLGLAAGIATGPGDQLSGDLALRYDLVRIAVRRRARFGDDRAWKDLDDRIELVADFSDPGGVQLDGEFAPQVLSTTWDVDLRVDGGPVAEEAARQRRRSVRVHDRKRRGSTSSSSTVPRWPCCPPSTRPDGPLPRVSWRARRRRCARDAGVVTVHRQHEHAALPAAGVDAPGFTRAAAGTIVRRPRWGSRASSRARTSTRTPRSAAFGSPGRGVRA